MPDPKGDLEQDKSYLYKMRKVKYKHRGFPRDSKERWKRYINDLHQEIKLSCKEELTAPAKLFQDTQSYDIVAKILNLPEKISPPRDPLAESSNETLVGLPKLHSGMKKSSKSFDYGAGSSLILTSSSMSMPSSSLVDMQNSSDESRFTMQERGSRYQRSTIISRDEAIFEDENVDDTYVNPPTPPPEEDMEPWVDKRSPYQKFFSLAEYKATRWRRGFSESKPKELLTVEEKEEHLYNSIATDFCKWVGECQFKNVQLDETTVTELFQVGMETPAVKAMCVQTKELPIVPAAVAQIFDMPEKSEMAGLRRQVRWDINYAELKEKGILDKPRWKSGQEKAEEVERKRKSSKTKQPRSTETLNRWFSTNLLRKEEKTGEMLWAQLEKTKVFKHFCNWMIDNEKMKKPQYLDKKGYFKSKYHIDESDMVRVVRMESESTPIESTVVSARNNLEALVSADVTYGNILDDLTQDIPTLSAFLGFDVAAKKAKPSKDKKKKGDELASPLKPLTEGIVDDGTDATVHYMALINHPEWP